MKDINTNKDSRTVHTKRSKGERLGWGNLYEQKQRPLREIAGDGEKVNPRNYCFCSHKTKLLIP